MVSFAAPAPVGTMLPPPPPIFKRPALSLKRDSSYLDADDEVGPTPSAKRLKVAFSDDVDVRVMDDWNDKSFELVKEEVRLSIQRHLAPVDRRDDTQYARLLHILNQDAFAGDAPSTKLLKRYIMAINWRITSLGECSKLVMAVLDLSWLGRDDELVEIYTKFLVMLASTHSKFISPMMDRLVANLERLPASTGRLPGEELVSRSVMFDRLHSVLQLLSRRVPSTANVLMRQLKHQFPNDMSTTKGHLQYQRHILRIAHELPELKTEMMALIVQRLVNIDVQIQQDIDDLEDDEEDRFLQRPQLGVNAGDPYESDDSDAESISESELTTTDDETRLRDLRLKVAKMDGTQDLLFEHYAPSFAAAPDQPRQNAAYLELLSQFENFIMPNRSRHTQFLLFHFAQTSPKYATHFASHCLSTACDKNIATTVRLTACAYVASFVARGSLVERRLVREVVNTLTSYLEDMRKIYEPNCQAPDRRAYSVYYAVAQALFYIFCFRWRDLVVGSSDPQLQGELDSEEDILAEGRDLLWMPGLKEILSRNMNSVLNPLKVCSAEIIGEFAKIANHLRFLYIFSLLERNKRIRLGQVRVYSRLGAGIDIGRRETAWDRKTGDAHHQLEPYFPFDPYHLPQSKRWVQNEYNNWKLPRGMKQDDEDERDESEEEYESDDESIPEDLTREPIGLVVADAIPVSSC